MTPVTIHPPAFLPQQDLCGVTMAPLYVCGGKGGRTLNRGSNFAHPAIFNIFLEGQGLILWPLFGNFQGVPGAQRVNNAFTLTAIILDTPTSLFHQTLRSKLDPELSSLPQLLQVLQVE